MKWVWLVFMLCLSACWVDSTQGLNTVGQSSESGLCVVVSATEFGVSGSLSVVDAETLAVATDLTAIHHDALVRVSGERVFVINRQGGDSIQEIDPARGWATLWQESVGNGVNPWDLTLLEDGTAWVPLYNSGSLLRIDTLSTGSQTFVQEGPVPLPMWTDRDERVEPSAVLHHDGVLFVTVQGLDSYPSCESDSRGYLHAFASDTLDPVLRFDGEPSLELSACNPIDQRMLTEDILVLAHAGQFRSVVGPGATDDGGLELVDLAAGNSLGLIASEADLGGRDVISFAIGEAGRAWVALADYMFSVSVYSARISEDEFSLGSSVWSSESGGIFSLGERWGRLWIADRTPGASGVVVLDAETGEPVLDGPLDTGFAPFDIGFVDLGFPCF